MLALWLHLSKVRSVSWFGKKENVACVSEKRPRLDVSTTQGRFVVRSRQDVFLPKMDPIESRRPGFLRRDLGGSGFVSPTRQFFFFFTFPSCVPLSSATCFSFKKRQNTVDVSEDTTQSPTPPPPLLSLPKSVSRSSCPQAVEESVHHSSVLLPSFLFLSIFYCTSDRDSRNCLPRGGEGGGAIDSPAPPWNTFQT